MRSCTLKAAFAALAAFVLTSAPALATDYPLTVTDLAGRTVEIPQNPQRVVLQDGRTVMTLALLDRKNPFKRVVLWNDLLERYTGWEVLSNAWPEMNKIPDMKFGDHGQVNKEDVLAVHPHLMIAEKRSLSSLQQAGVIESLEAMHIPLLFIDTVEKPTPNAMKSVALLGKVLDRETQAKEYTDFYAAHLDRLKTGIAAAGTHPKVFVEVMAGKQGVSQCCFTHASIGWGALVRAVGGQNIGAKLLPGAKGNVTLETVIAEKPDVYVMTGRQAKGKAAQMIPFGYATSEAKVQAAMKPFLERPGVASIKASREGRVYGLWHYFYSHPYNIVALEWLAKMMYPAQFTDLDPQKTWDTLIDRFTDLPSAPIILEANAGSL